MQDHLRVALGSFTWERGANRDCIVQALLCLLILA